MKAADRRRAAAELGSLARHRAYLGLPPKKGPVTPFPCDPGEVFEKQTAGLAKRLAAIECRSAVIGLSGGLDSTLALAVTAAAFDRLGLGRSGLHAITMPGFGTGARTRGNAAALCAGLGLALETISIVPACRRHFRDIGHDGVTPDVTFENAQARMRTLILMDRANMTGGIVVGTGDMSESALGWCTYNGDHMSMFSVNGGVPKTVVRGVCEWYAARPGTDPRLAAAVNDVVATPISPELVPGQVTENVIGPYELHDFFLWNFIVNEMGSLDLAAAARGFFSGGGRPRFSGAMIDRTLKTFMRRFFTQAFKRNCQPDCVRVFPFELSPRGWWVPSDIGPVDI